MTSRPAAAGRHRPIARPAARPAAPPAFPSARRLASRAAALAACLPGLLALPLAAALVAPGCMLFEEQVGFRTYELRQVGYEEGVELVRRVTQQFFTERFGGIGIAWDAETRNLEVDEIYAGDRRLKLYVHLEPVSGGVDVELLALVHTLQPGGGPQVWGHPQQDVPLEQMLYDAYLAAWLDLRSEG